LRTAPGTLERRVLAEIERRAAQPAWHQGFMHWPIAARLAFLLASVGIVKLALDAVMWLFTDTRSASVMNKLERPVSWAESTANLFSLTARLGEALLHAIPPLWLYAGIAIAVFLYAALFALGATAYRTLYLNK
jgi:hypothetical protein